MGQHGCGGGTCGCGGESKAAAVTPAVEMPDPMKSDDIAPVAQVNGVPLHGAGESPDPEALRQRAYSELLRQAAQRAGLLAMGDLPALEFLGQHEGTPLSRVPLPEQRPFVASHCAQAAHEVLGLGIAARMGRVLAGAGSKAASYHREHQSGKEVFLTLDFQVNAPRFCYDVLVSAGA